MSEQFSVIGKRVSRNDAVEKVTGEAKYVADLQLPGMLYARFVRSPHAHARIADIDTSLAEALQGVKAILTHKNVPKVHPRGKLRYLLDETVHSAGEEVAAVAAVTKEIAEEAIKLINVEYEVLPAVFDAEQAMKPGAPVVYPEYGTNMYHGTPFLPAPRVRPDGWLPVEIGDVAKGFAEADHVIEGTYETPMQYQCSPMPRSVVCQWTGAKLTCWACTQKPTSVWQDLAKCLGMPQSNVRVIVTYAVGGYGGKEPEETAIMAAILAKRAGRPVKAIYTREEDFIATRHRPNYKVYEKIGLKNDGTITAMQHKMIGNFGKDGVLGFLIQGCSAVYTCNTLYPCPNTKYEGCLVITNIDAHGSMNGFGDAEANYCVDRALDEAAEKIGMDPVEFRLKNCMRYGTRGLTADAVLGLRGIRPAPNSDLNWGIVGKDADSVPQCIRKAAEEAQWQKKWKGWRTPVAVNGAKRRGIGLATGIHSSSYVPYSAIVKMNHDGTANVLTSAAEIGQGCSTAMAQVVAEVLGLRFEDVSMLMADTAATPAGSGNVASGGTSGGIAAAKLAAEDARQKLFAIAAAKLGVKPEDLAAKNRRIFVKADPAKGMAVAEACLMGYQVTGVGANPPQSSIIDEKTGKVTYHFAAAATIVEVEVDTETGQLDVLAVTSAHECGRAINPQLIEGQIDLGIVMGNGWVRSENLIVDESTGVIINPNLVDYKIMTMLDMPKSENMREVIVEGPCAWGPFGAKGMSETSATTTAPALANAVYHAIGVRIRGPLLTPEKILEALRK